MYEFGALGDRFFQIISLQQSTDRLLALIQLLLAWVVTGFWTVCPKQITRVSDAYTCKNLPVANEVARLGACWMNWSFAMWLKPLSTR